MENILELMLEDHERIKALLDSLKESLQEENQESTYLLFDKLRWEVEKHIFTEEKAVFIFCNDGKGRKELLGGMERLKKDHDKILDMLRLMDVDLKNEMEIDIKGFEDFMKKHEDFEEGDFYPLLDDSLSEEKKRIIVNRISNKS